ncbi:MAG: thermonuclease family protein [Acidimicrobiales bacterium]
MSHSTATLVPVPIRPVHPSHPTAQVAALAVVLALAAVGCGGRGRAAPGEDGRAQVVRVVDGDTIVVRLGGVEEKVRLLGIDTPESVDPRSPVQCFGKEASAHTATLLPPGTEVRLVRDVEARDRYSRLLAYVYRADDGAFVNLQLAQEGYADVLTYPPNVAHADAITAAVAQARGARRGLWSAC